MEGLLWGHLDGSGTRWEAPWCGGASPVAPLPGCPEVGTWLRPEASWNRNLGVAQN